MKRERDGQKERWRGKRDGEKGVCGKIGRKMGRERVGTADGEKWDDRTHGQHSKDGYAHRRTFDVSVEGAGRDVLSGILDGDEVVAGRQRRVAELIAFSDLATQQFHSRRTADVHGLHRVHYEITQLTYTRTRQPFTRANHPHRTHSLLTPTPRTLSATVSSEHRLYSLENLCDFSSTSVQESGRGFESHF